MNKNKITKREALIYSALATVIIILLLTYFLYPKIQIKTNTIIINHTVNQTVYVNVTHTVNNTFNFTKYSHLTQLYILTSGINGNLLIKSDLWNLTVADLETGPNSYNILSLPSTSTNATSLTIKNLGQGFYLYRGVFAAHSWWCNSNLNDFMPIIYINRNQTFNISFNNINVLFLTFVNNYNVSTPCSGLINGYTNSGSVIAPKT